LIVPWPCPSSLISLDREVANELGFEISRLQLLEYSTYHSPTLGPEEIWSKDLVALPSPEPEQYAQRLQQSHLTSEEQEQSWLYYLTDITLRRLEIRIDAFFREESVKRIAADLQARTSFYQHVLTTLADLDDQIINHLNQLPTSITVAIDDSDNFHSPDDLREYLRLRTMIIRHTLSRPALCFCLHGMLDGLPSWIQELAFHLANRALAISGYLVEHGLTTHRHPATWLGIRYCTQAALELMATAKSRKKEIVLPPSWTTGLERLKTALLYWSAESRHAQIYLELLHYLDSH
jgi:hypothetical protein